MRDCKRGLMAAMWIQKSGEEDAGEFKAVGHFIEDMDFFEKQKRVILDKFGAGDIDDDIYVLSHRDELI